MARRKIKIVLEIDSYEWDDLLENDENDNLGVPEVLENLRETLNESIPVHVDAIKILENE